MDFWSCGVAFQPSRVSPGKRANGKPLPRREPLFSCVPEFLQRRHSVSYKGAHDVLLCIDVVNQALHALFGFQPMKRGAVKE